MIENCEHCRWRKDLVKFDYSKGGCIHTRQEGYACTALEYENEVVWMVGNSEKTGMCEMFQSKEEKS